MKTLSQQAINKAIKLRSELLEEIKNNNNPDTGKIIVKIGENPVEVAHLMNFCQKIDEKYGTTTVVDLLVELEIRYDK